MSAPRITQVILNQIEAHAKSVTDREVGGVLVGTLGNGSITDTEIIAAIPALKAVGASANVTFTHEVWDEALQIVDRDHPGKRIVGWYHSHPDFGVFLSEYDLFIQRNFFPLPGMTALVVDPIRGEAGWFTTVHEEVVQTGSYAIDPVIPAAAADAQQAVARSRSYATLLYSAAAVLIAFVVGWVVSPSDSGTNNQSAVAAANRRASEAQQRVAALESELADNMATTSTPGSTPTVPDGGTEPVPTTPAPTPDDAPPVTGTNGNDPSMPSIEIVYSVRANDSLWSMAERFYGDGYRWREIAEANGITSGNIDPGDTLVIPDLGGEPGAFDVRATHG